ncbi:hypothetical protein H5992_10695, partial [Limosilactobacillus reuteri]|nr:hypothetical protein [Limosilactobacillus reuteri]
MKHQHPGRTHRPRAATIQRPVQRQAGKYQQRRIVVQWVKHQRPGQKRRPRVVTTQR